jgi:phenylacetate-CoA ligase
LLRAFLVAGEPMSAARRDRLQEIWGGRRVFEDYGSTETGSLAGECAAGSLHLWTDRVHCEVLLASGETSEFGSGELVVTPYHREAMPLVRYRMGDAVTISRNACGCGSALPTIRINGRLAAAVPVGDRAISQSAVEDLVYRLPLKYRASFWRARSRHGGIEIEVEADRTHEVAIGDELSHQVFANLGVRAEVVTRDPGGIVPRALLVGGQIFTKPRYLFSEGDDWNEAIRY